MGVKLREKKNTSGRRSLYLDINSGGKRWKEYLNLTLEAGRSPQITAINTNTKEAAVKLRNNRENELIASQGNITKPHRLRNVPFLDFFKKIKDDYPNKDIRLIMACQNYYTQFSQKNGHNHRKVSEIDKQLCEDFLLYLKKYVRGETILNYFTKFKYVLIRAAKQGIIKENPSEGIKVTRDGGIKKDILSLGEIRQMSETHCSNQVVKNAFLFCCFTGLRWVDTKGLTFGQIDYQNGYIKITQQKTQGSSGSASLTVPITETIKGLLPPQSNKKSGDVVFDLPSHSYASRCLKDWVKAAAINKSVSWHCSRHSYAVLLLTEAKTDVKTAASLLGHSGLKHFEKYTRAVDSLRVQAANKINL